MKTWVCVFTLFGIAALSACRSSVSPVPAISRPAIDAAASAAAWGKVVDDPSGKPLAHVPVALEPWKPCRAKPDVPWATKTQKPWKQHETLVCPKAIVTVETRSDGRFTFKAPAGHYLLVIGTDDPSDLTRPTIHDQIWLTGGSQHLLAPRPCPTLYPPGKVPMGARCLPPIPQITFPAPERSTDYRLVTISHWEKPCIRAFDSYRAKWNLDPAVVDEWLTENNRAQIAQVRVPHRVLYANGEITAGFAYQPSGDRNCNLSLMKLAGIFEERVEGSLFYSVDPRTHWIAALNRTLLAGEPQDVWISNGEYPRDPRDWSDRLYPSWP